MDRTRRAVVLGAGTALLSGLAGCGGDGEDGSDGTPTEATEDQETETQTPTVETVVDEELHLREDDYQSWQFYVDGEFTLDYEVEVLEGSAIDVYVVENRQLQPFQAQQVFDSAVASESVESDTVSATLEEGTYHVIVDHSARGSAEPPGGLTQDPVDVRITASYQKTA